MTNHIGIILCSILLGFCLGFIILVLWEKIKTRGKPTDEKERIRSLRLQLDRALEKDTFTTKHTSFTKSLKDAGINNELQISQFRNRSKSAHTVPEKYTILNRLISQGLDKKEIASILDISIVEVSQLINLRSISESES